MKVMTLAAVLLALAVPSACGGSNASPSAGSVTVRPAPGASAETTELPSDATLRTYFDGVAEATLSSYEDAEAAAVPGSAAAGYVTYLRAAAQAVVDSGEKVSASGTSAEVVDGAYRFCTESGSGKVCYRYTDITGAGGKIVDFSVNGKPVGDRVAVGTDTPVPASGVDARATFVAAFENTAGENLFVAVRLEAGARDLSGVRATYGASGSPSPSARMAGPKTVRAGDAASYVLAFPGARLGGTLTVTMRDDAGTSGTVVLGIS